MIKKRSINNPRITKKERGLIKGALRRVFSRSDLRKKVLDSADIHYRDPNRPRVKKWSLCPVCNKVSPKYLMVVDHISPIVPTNTSFDAMSMDIVVDRIWCEENNLQAICPSCHAMKTSSEKKERMLNKKKGITDGKKR